jgi:hypothetical protein
MALAGSGGDWLGYWLGLFRMAGEHHSDAGQQPAISFSWVVITAAALVFLLQLLLLTENNCHNPSIEAKS